jgi:CheY-like chemotaxis protein
MRSVESAGELEETGNSNHGAISATIERIERALLAPTGQSARVLVVDDNVDTVRGMEILLRYHGYDVKTASDGLRAIDIARWQKPQFVLLDIGLPGVDGYEIACRLRREAWFADCVLVAISGYGREEDRRRSREAGFNHHMIKPVDHRALFSLLATSVG